jgi:hypothetical protein
MIHVILWAKQFFSEREKKTPYKTWDFKKNHRIGSLGRLGLITSANLIILKKSNDGK